MDAKTLEAKFAALGARFRVEERSPRRIWGGRAWWQSSPPSKRIAIDIEETDDRSGERFVIRCDAGMAAEVEVEVLDARPRDRHLLLLARDEDGKSKYLCGHDERHWFVAAIPESAPVGTVEQAKEALKPEPVRIAQAKARVPSRARQKRKNEAFRRQGEWFFLPEPEFRPDPRELLRNEPFRRGRGKAHRAEFAHRSGGDTVHVSRKHPNGLTNAEHRAFLKAIPEARNWDWRVMTRDAVLRVKGKIRHADHKTIDLRGWHRVELNTETRARAMARVAFLD